MAISTKTTYANELEKDIHDLIMGRQDIITYESSFDELNVYRSMKIQVRKLAELLADLGYRKIDDEDDIADAIVAIRQKTDEDRWKYF